MKIVIEYGIPLARNNDLRKRKYPFNKMDVGDSFEIPFKKVSAVRQSATNYAKDHGVKFSVRRTGTDTARCWRIA